MKSFAAQLAAKIEVKSEETIIKTEEEEMTVMKKEEMEQIGIKREDGLEEEVEAKKTVMKKMKTVMEKMKKMTKKSAKRKADDTQIVKVEEEVVMRRSKRPRIFKVEYRDASASPS